MRRNSNQLLMLVGVCLASIGSAPSAWADCGGCIADLDGCGNVNTNDVFLLLIQWGPCGECTADFNDDAVVDGEDLGYLLGHWGPCVKNLPFPTPAPIELVVVEITDPETESQGLREFDLFAAFDNPTDRLLNVLNASASCDEPPCWVDNFLPFAMPLFQSMWKKFGFTYDCYVTIGLPFLDDNTIFLDPNFSEQDFTEGTSMGVDAGWASLPIVLDQGMAGNYPDNQVLIASFTTPVGTTIEGELSIIYQDSADQLFIATESFLINIDDCPWDLDDNGVVGASDLLSLLAAWGLCPPKEFCPADFDNNGSVGASDLLVLLANWGPCP